MSKIILERAYLIGTYFLAILNMAWSFSMVKDIIIFIATTILICIQIKRQWLLLKKTEKEHDEKKTKLFELR